MAILTVLIGFAGIGVGYFIAHHSHQSSLTVYQERVEELKKTGENVKEAFYEGTRIQFGEKPVSSEEDKNGYVVDFSQVEHSYKAEEEAEELQYEERFDGVYR